MANPPTDHAVVIHIDRKPYKTTSHILTGRQIRSLSEPDIGTAFELYLDVPNGADHVIGDDQPITIEPGMHFYSVQRATNPG